MKRTRSKTIAAKNDDVAYLLYGLGGLADKAASPRAVRIRRAVRTVRSSPEPPFLLLGTDPP
jgi:hypothetical protein